MQYIDINSMFNLIVPSTVILKLHRFDKDNLINSEFYKINVYE